MKTVIKFFSIITISLCLFYQNALPSDKIKIGLIVPLSGEYSEIGNSLLSQLGWQLIKLMIIELK